jgi:type I restriction-modification system DNA methylase subunit
MYVGMVSTQPAKTDIYDVAAHLWDTADELRANSHLKAGDYSIAVLGLIFLKFADSRFSTLEGGAQEQGQRSARHWQGGLPGQGRPVSAWEACDRLAKEQRTRAAVRVAVEEALDRLPDKFTRQICAQKCNAVYQHVFDSYFDDGQSVYDRAA